MYDATDRLEYSLLPNSCDGEPAPSRLLPGAAFIPPSAVGFPKGERTALPEGGSIGDVLAVDAPDRGRLAEI